MALPDYTTQDAATYKANIDAALPLNTITIDIGDWDMNADDTTTVSHGLTASKIRTAIVTIINDASNDWVNLIVSEANDVSTTTSSTLIRWNSTQFTLSRARGGFFDSVLHDSTSFNRGWITIQYTD